MIFTDRIRHAIDVAARAHYGQERRDPEKTPAISHPFGVAMILAQYPDTTEDTIIGGLLHDVIEDVDANIFSPQDIKVNFGPNVLEIVQQVSDDTSIRDWEKRKIAYLEVLGRARFEALMVSAADMTHNLSSFIDSFQRDPDGFSRRFTGTPELQVWFYGERAGLIHKRLNHPIAELALETYSRFENALAAHA